jgi:hypothetical protein
MVAIPTLEDEDARRPSRERESLVGERTRIINRMRICRKFRVRAITMEKKETSYGETEATGYFRRAA